MRTERKPPSCRKATNLWLDIVTLWALESDGRRRDRILVAHGLRMKIIERGTVEAFRCALDDPRFDGRFALSCGIGYDLERLEEELDVVFGDGNSAHVRTRLDGLYDRALIVLGDARREARKEGDAAARRQAFRNWFGRRNICTTALNG